MEMNNRVLVTGSEGYIGSVLMPMVANEGYELIGLDACFFSEGNLNSKVFGNYTLIKKDIRDICENDLENLYAVVHLAAISNDPLGKLNENLTYEINYRSSVDVAVMAKKMGVARFIFSSSCSLYGAGNKTLTEKDSANPQTAYGKSKILAENEISKLADENFSPVFLRNATAYGISPRMRFDLVVNSLTGYAKTENKIRILGDGTPWRPLVHVKDISNVIIKALSAPANVIHNQAFNVGSSEENYQIKSIAEKVKNRYRECEIEIAQKNSGDLRNYVVSFEKLNNILGVKTEIPLTEGIDEIANCYEKINLDISTFNSPAYTRLKQIELLISEGKIDSDLKWKAGVLENL
jgi:nucleoside-diphosphate-sugar epimerase